MIYKHSITWCCNKTPKLQEDNELWGKLLHPKSVLVSLSYSMQAVGSRPYVLCFHLLTWPICGWLWMVPSPYYNWFIIELPILFSYMNTNTDMQVALSLDSTNFKLCHITHIKSPDRPVSSLFLDINWIT